MNAEKESCVNCKYFFAADGKVPWITNYYCTCDGSNRFLGRFDDYTGYATNKARIELGHRCCIHFKDRSVERLGDTND